MEQKSLTIGGLQKALCIEIEKITSDMIFENQVKKNVKLKAYEQALPIRVEANYTPAEDEAYTGEDEIETDNPFPYAIVKIDTGNISNSVKINTVVVIGIYYADMKNDGHITLLNIIQKTNERFSKNPTLAETFRMSEGSFEFAMQEDDSYPYYYAAMKMSWEVPAIRREDPLA